MLKNIILLMSSLSLVISLTACTSTEVEKEDSDVAELSGDESLEIAEGEDPFGVDSDFASGDGGGDVAGLSPEEQLPDDVGGDTFASSGDDPFAEPAPSGADDPFAEPAGDSFAGGGDDPFAEPADSGSNFADSTTPPAAEYAESGDTFSEPMDAPSIEDSAENTPSFDESDTYESDEPVRRNIPVKKIADAPYRQAGVLVNAVYIARPGDTVESVSQKIYGADRSEDLYGVNPTLRGRELKTGAKVYYNSPNRPNDETRLLTYYEDLGLAPEIYVARDGDNIRTVSKNLLGDDRSWQEVWATNLEVESKGELAAGTQLRYWGAADVPSVPSLASAPPPPPEPSFDDMPPPPPSPAEDSVANLPPPPPPLPEDSFAPPPDLPDVAQNELPPPPPPEPSFDDLPPPPPSAGMVEPPPPPPPPPPAQTRSAAVEADAGQDETMILGVGALLLLVAVGLFIMRKKKAKRQLDFNTSTQTQIE